MGTSAAERGRERKGGRRGEGKRQKGKQKENGRHAIIIKEEEGKVHVTLEPTRKAVPLERSSLCEWQRVWVHSYACRELRQSLFCSLFVTPGPWRERYLQLFFFYFAPIFPPWVRRCAAVCAYYCTCAPVMYTYFVCARHHLCRSLGDEPAGL